jgi:phage shock protein A
MLDLDRAVVEECVHCLVGAAVYEGSEADLALSAMALTRDLADTHKGQALALLEAAAHRAAWHLDASDLGTDAFSAALHRLASIRSSVEAMLVEAAC